MNSVFLMLSMLFTLGGISDRVPTPSIKQEIDRKEATVGDRLHFRVDIFTEPDKEVVLPENLPALGKLVVKNRNIKTIIRKGYKRTTLEYELVSYDVGKDTIPALSIVVKKGNETKKLETLPVYIEIKSVAPDLTGNEDIKGLKPQIWIRFSHLFYLFVFLSLAVIAGISLFLIRLRRKKQTLEKVRTKPPWETALKGLDKLLELKPTTDKEIKHFYTELSFILREYLEAIYTFPALENTTDEIVNYLKRRRDYKPHLSKTHDFLDKSDLVKFAKYVPSEFNKEEEIGTVKTIVEKTKPEEEEKND